MNNISTELRKHFPERLKAYILKQFRKPEFEAWIAVNDSSIDIHPTFEEFIHFMEMFPLTFYNEHFKPSLELCSPCAINYDLFLNFKTLEYDLFALMEYLGMCSNYVVCGCVWVCVGGVWGGRWEGIPSILLVTESVGCYCILDQ